MVDEQEPEPAENAAFEDLEQSHMPKKGLPMSLWPSSPDGVIVLWLAGEIIAAFPAGVDVHLRAAELLHLNDLDAHKAYLNQFAKPGYLEDFKREMVTQYQREAALEYAREIAAGGPARQGRRDDN